MDAHTSARSIAWSAVALARALSPGVPVDRLPMMNMLSFYFDESEEQESMVFTIAGFVADPATWDLFTPKWQAMLDEAPHPISEFHMKDVVAQQKEFANWTRSECDALIIRAVDTIKETSKCGLQFTALGCSISPRVMGWSKKDAPSEFSYVSCYIGIMVQAILGRIDARPFNFVFDDREKVRQHVNNHFYKSKAQIDANMPALKGLFGAVAFGDSKTVLPLQAADLLAWERRKRTGDRVMNNGRVQRKSFGRLCEIDHVFWVFEAEDFALESLLKHQPVDPD